MIVYMKGQYIVIISFCEIKPLSNETTSMDFVYDFYHKLFYLNISCIRVMQHICIFIMTSNSVHVHTKQLYASVYAMHHCEVL